MKKFAIFLAFIAVFAIAVFFAKNQAGPAVNATVSPANTGGNAELASLKAVSGGQQQLIDQMNQVILSVKSRADVLPAVAKIEELAKLDTNNQFPAVQIYRAAALLVPELEGVVYRCRSFIEPSDWIHMSVLFGLRDFSYNDYLYGPHIKALFDFVTYPSDRVGGSFKTVSDLQNFALNRIAPRLKMFSDLLAKLDAIPAQNFEFSFDRTILVGQGPGLRFIDPSETKKLFIKPYIYTLNFLTQRALGSIYYASAMDLDELPIVFNRVIRQTTINAFTGDLRLTAPPAKGVTPQMTYETIKGTKSFLAWRNDINLNGKRVGAQELLDSAFAAGVSSSYLQLAAYVCNIKYAVARAHGQVPDLQLKRDCASFDQETDPSAYFVANGSDFLFNPNSLTIDFKEKYHMFRDRARLYGSSKKNGRASITSDVTGQTLTVNLHAFFEANRSQRDFLPTGYSSNEASRMVPKMNVRAWNYDYGKPMTFRDYTFNGFFDPSEVRDSASLYHAMTTVLYTKAIAPFAIFIRVPSTVRYFIPPSEIIKQ